MKLFFVGLCALFAISNAQLDWNALKVTMGPIPGIGYAFADVPRTTDEATSFGWRALENGCDNTNLPFRGTRYIVYDPELEREDYTVMPIYDANGFIAGIQMGFPLTHPTYPAGFPSRQQTEKWVQQDMVDGTAMHILTAYFINPDRICRGRTQAEFDREGTGNALFFQKPGRNNFETIPLTQTGAVNSAWSQGQCFISMGMHFWYAVTGLDMDCNDFQNAFLLYSPDGRLDGWGWAIFGDLPSPRLEHPTAAVLPAFFPIPYPRCMEDGRLFSTIHIYMSDRSGLRPCP